MICGFGTGAQDASAIDTAKMTEMLHLGFGILTLFRPLSYYTNTNDLAPPAHVAPMNRLAETSALFLLFTFDNSEYSSGR